VLADEAERARYLEELKGATKSVDVGPLLEAEDNFLKATILVKARKYPEALALLDKAIRQNPGEAEFLAWRAWARFVSSQDKRAAFEAAAAECQKALGMDGRCAAAHMFLGNMAKVLGDGARAEKEYRQVLSIAPDNTEAKRELRLFKNRK
jgi:tetratricopeptide (TPR) repeat protein